ncbi:hypothetical protein D3C81_1834070 [compost metagenome]
MIECLQRLARLPQQFVGFTAHAVRDSRPVGPVLCTFCERCVGGTQCLPGAVRRRIGLEQVAGRHDLRGVVALVEACGLKRFGILELAGGGIAEAAEPLVFNADGLEAAFSIHIKRILVGPSSGRRRGEDRAASIEVKDF